MVSVTWIVAIIHVAIKAMRTREPRASADEDSACEPVRPIVSIRSAVIGRIVKISIGAYRRNADANRTLCSCRMCCGGFGRAAHQSKGESDKHQRFPPDHVNILQAVYLHI